MRLPMELLLDIFDMLVEEGALHGNMALLQLCSRITQSLYHRLYRRVALRERKALRSFHKSVMQHVDRASLVRSLELDVAFDSDNSVFDWHGRRWDLGFVNMQADVISVCRRTITQLTVRTIQLHPAVSSELRCSHFSALLFAHVPAEIYLSVEPALQMEGDVQILKEVLQHPRSTKYSDFWHSQYISPYPVLTRLHVDVEESISWLFAHPKDRIFWRWVPNLKEVSMAFRYNPGSWIGHVQRLSIPSHWNVFAVLFWRGWDDYFNKTQFCRARFNRKFVVINMAASFSTQEEEEYGSGDDDEFQERLKVMAISGVKINDWDECWTKINEHVKTRDRDDPRFHDDNTCISL